MEGKGDFHREVAHEGPKRVRKASLFTDPSDKANEGSIYTITTMWLVTRHGRFTMPRRDRTILTAPGACIVCKIAYLQISCMEPASSIIYRFTRKRQQDHKVPAPLGIEPDVIRHRNMARAR